MYGDNETCQSRDRLVTVRGEKLHVHDESVVILGVVGKAAFTQLRKKCVAPARSLLSELGAPSQVGNTLLSAEVVEMSKKVAGLLADEAGGETGGPGWRGGWILKVEGDGVGRGRPDTGSGGCDGEVSEGCGGGGFVIGKGGGRGGWEVVELAEVAGVSDWTVARGDGG